MQSAYDAAYEAFKFQSDSINTWWTFQFVMFRKSFKFQSDSINTEKPQEGENAIQTLNSNLILLILEAIVSVWTAFNL